jgi:hypothetical protein
MTATFLRLLITVFIPAVAGFIITMQLVISFGPRLFPSLDPGGLAMIPMTGLVTAMLCLVFVGTRRLIARRAA